MMSKELIFFSLYVYQSIKNDDNYVEQRMRRKHFIRLHDNLRLLFVCACNTVVMFSLL